MALPDEFLAIVPAWIRDNPSLADAWVESYIEAGGNANMEFASKAAATNVRQSEGYKQIFPAMFDDDGNMRFVSDPEATYQRTMESYRNTLRSLNVNPEVFEERLHGLIEGSVSAGEFVQRAETIYENVIESSPEIRSWYAENFGKDMTDQAIIASFLDGPDGPISSAILEDRIAMAQIGGAAEQRGFSIDIDFADMLEDTGLTGRGAAEFFGQAASLIPAMQVLQRRHSDTDDPFDLNTFAEGMVFDNPEMRRDIRRLQAQESSAFTGGAGVEIRKGDAGVAGLQAI